MPAETINPFELPFPVKIGDEVKFCTETETKKTYFGRIVNIGTDGHKTFYDIMPIDGRENEFPSIRPSLVARVTRGFIIRRITPC